MKKYKWTEGQEYALRGLWKLYTAKEVEKILRAVFPDFRGTLQNIWSKAFKLGLTKNVWTPEVIEWLRENRRRMTLDKCAVEIERIFGFSRSACQLHTVLKKYNITKPFSTTKNTRETTNE